MYEEHSYWETFKSGRELFKLNQIDEWALFVSSENKVLFKITEDPVSSDPEKLPLDCN
jgi:hypothetical protein